MNLSRVGSKSATFLLKRLNQSLPEGTVRSPARVRAADQYGLCYGATRAMTFNTGTVRNFALKYWHIERKRLPIQPRETIARATENTDQLRQRSSALPQHIWKHLGTLSIPLGIAYFHRPI